MYQVHHKTLPHQLTALFETRTSDSNYNFRRINTFSHAHYNCNFGRNSVRYRGPIVWNLIPKPIKDTSSQQLFRQKLRQALRILATQVNSSISASTRKRKNFDPCACAYACVMLASLEKTRLKRIRNNRIKIEPKGRDSRKQIAILIFNLKDMFRCYEHHCKFQTI